MTDSHPPSPTLFRRVFTDVHPTRRFDVWAIGCPEADAVIGHAEIKRTDEVGGHEIVYALHPGVRAASSPRTTAPRPAT